VKISATVITLDEERHIAAALESLSWADEIVVVDSGSSDRTLEIARGYTDRVIVADWPGYAAQKNRAAGEASHDWIFSLDADERVTPELAASIARARERESSSEGYRVARRAWYIDRWVRHSGWYPDWQVRLYNRRRARFEGDWVHESVRVQGAAPALEGDLLHYTIDSLSDHHRRIDQYTSLAADALLARGARSSLARAVVQPVAAFARTYVLRQGFRDGAPGLAIAGFAAYYVFLRQMKLWELGKGGGRRKEEGGRREEGGGESRNER
jgi:glycosyltransferase involved in cell wall biosynthesis